MVAGCTPSSQYNEFGELMLSRFELIVRRNLLVGSQLVGPLPPLGSFARSLRQLAAQLRSSGLFGRIVK